VVLTAFDFQLPHTAYTYTYVCIHIIRIYTPCCLCDSGIYESASDYICLQHGSVHCSAFLTRSSYRCEPRSNHLYTHWACHVGIWCLLSVHVEPCMRTMHEPSSFIYSWSNVSGADYIFRTFRSGMHMCSFENAGPTCLQRTCRQLDETPSKVLQILHHAMSSRLPLISYADLHGGSPYNNCIGKACVPV